MFYFTSDEHYGHFKVIAYNSRPFDSAEEMDSVLIRNFNEVVTPQDVTIHAGDFGHSHGKLTREAKQFDIGVDNNNYYPVSWEKIKQVMADKPDNPIYRELFPDTEEI